MCGIAGIVNINGVPINPDHLQAMQRELFHRGPDARGFYCNETDNHFSVGFAHTRLSIIDIESGQQPFVSDQGNVLTFNGEIFNYLEIRSELLKKGVSFFSQSDTEVILKLYENEGIQGFKKLNGQFAFLLYDKRRREVLAIRDYCGEKPLYYYILNGYILFASEVKAILVFLKRNGVSYTLHQQAFLDYLSFNYVPLGQTLIKGIYSVHPGTLLRISQEGISHERYEHQLSMLEDKNSQIVIEKESTKEKDLIDIFKATIEESVKLRLRSDVPVGIYFSGGIDSMIVALTAKKINSSIQGFTARFIEDTSFDESSFAAKMAALINIPLETIAIDPKQYGFEKLAMKLAYHGDTPLADSSAIPVFLLSEQAKRSVKVILSGDGADELFGGYLTYQASLLAERIPMRLKYTLSEIAHNGAFQKVLWLLQNESKVSFSEKILRFSRNLRYTNFAAHLAWNGSLGIDFKMSILNSEFFKSTHEFDSYKRIARFFQNTIKTDIDKRSSLRAYLELDRVNYLVYDILEKVDRMSMAHGLEVRAPFLDPKVIQYSRIIESKYVYKKLILKKFLERYLPAYPVASKKKGFSVPLNRWFRNDLKSIMHDLLTSESTRQSQWFNTKELMKLWEEHQKGVKSIGYELWGIMIFLLWEREFLQR
jgi:asparagine synthase (glutamine-hydrolysing)